MEMVGGGGGEVGGVEGVGGSVVGDVMVLRGGWRTPTLGGKARKIIVCHSNSGTWFLYVHGTSHYTNVTPGSVRSGIAGCSGIAR